MTPFWVIEPIPGRRDATVHNYLDAKHIEAVLWDAVPIPPSGRPVRLFYGRASARFPDWLS